MSEHRASEAWNNVLVGDLLRIQKRLAELRPLLQPKQIPIGMHGSKPPELDPVIMEYQLPSIGALAVELQSVLSSDDAMAVLDDAAQELATREISALQSSQNEPDVDRKLSRSRRIRFDRVLSWGVLGLGKLFRGFALLRHLKPLKWARLIPKFAWRAVLIPIKWLALAGALSWRALIKPLLWGAKLAGRVILGPIGWALLAGELLWHLLIKPLGWDKYITEIDWAHWFSFEWVSVLPVWDWLAIIPVFNLGKRLFYNGAAPSGSSSDPAEVQRAVRRGQSLGYSSGGDQPTQGARALGGPVRAGLLYQINEQGQEYFSPNRDGHVVPAGKIMAGGNQGGRSLRIGDINIHAAPGMSPIDIAKAVRRELERMADAAGAALHDGGAYAG